MKKIVVCLGVLIIGFIGTFGQEPVRIQAVGRLEILTPGFFTNVLKTNFSGLKGASARDALVVGSAHGSLLVSGSGIQFPKGIDPLLRLTDMAQNAATNVINALSSLEGHKFIKDHFGDRHFGPIRLTYWSVDIEAPGWRGNMAEGYFVDGENMLWKLQWWGASSNRWNLTNVVLSIRENGSRKGP